MCKSELLKVKKFKYGGYDKFYLSLNLNSVREKSKIIELYNFLFDYIKEHNIITVYEKVFGDLTFEQQLRDVRSKVIMERGLKKTPFSYIEGKPVTGSLVSSIVVYGVVNISEKIEVGYYNHYKKDLLNATCLKINEEKFYYLNGLYKEAEGETKKEVFQSFFEELGAYLDKNQIRPNSIVRTWYYLKDIVQNYSCFNEERKRFYESMGIDCSVYSDKLPASTGIEGKMKKNALVSTDIYCIDNSTNGLKIERVYNSMQNEAAGDDYLFKPSFSRGMLIEDKESIEMQVSGTASIDEKGDTVFVDDSYNQVKRTLQNVKSLLFEKGLDFFDICQSTCFFKDKSVYQEFLKVQDEVGFNGVSETFVIADVCRDDLLFEFDGIALKMK